MTTYQEVNEGLKAIIEYLNSIDNVWNKTRNLKLYDVSFHAGEIINKYPLVKEEYNECDLFSWFCDDSYNQFTEWMQEEKIEDCRKYVGRTSSFYLTDMHCDKIGYVIDNLMNTVYGYNLDFDEDGNMIPFTDTDYYTEAELIAEYQEDMTYISSGDFLEDIKKYFADAVKIADYIDDFMKNQIEYFTEYIECQNENLEYQAEQEQKREQAFVDKYSNAISDITADIEAVMVQTGCNIADMSRIISKAMEQVNPTERRITA